MADHFKKMAERPLNELLSRDMVDIYVGPDNTHWILHEKLLCARSSFFRQIFYDSSNSTKSFGLPDDDDAAFKAFVGWLYSGVVPPPRKEADLGVCFELYLMGERWGIEGLRKDVLDVVQTWYHESNTYPGLRRVQYVYANTEEGSEMRSLLVGSVARMLVLGRDGLPKHWDKALRKNGQLAVDIITMVQRWKLDENLIPDVRVPQPKGNIPQLQDGPGNLEQSAKDAAKEATNQANNQADNATNQVNNTTKEVLDTELPNGVADGVPDGLPSGAENEVTKQAPKKDLPNGLPKGLPNGTHKDLPNGLPNGIGVH